ncbi:MAG: hypothetical protein KGH66_01030 [Candidatus Micrarchaeota archaeon]|nr:hypothetical protein [Candidatus Micrarchaeota archaeon]
MKSGGLTTRQVKVGWEIIQDKFKGVNQFSEAIKINNSKGTYIREIFLAFYRELSKESTLPPRADGEQKPKPRVSRY